MLDENEFLSAYGIRSLSRFHADHPYVIHVGGQEYRVAYLPAESDTGMFGGNSNWRGPIWMPVNALIIRALLQYYAYYGDDFTVECPTGSGRQMNLYQVAEEIGRRLARIFLQDKDGRRPVYGGTEKFQDDPHWRDCVLFYEYFHGDNGAGLGASHQTGWSLADRRRVAAGLPQQPRLAAGVSGDAARPARGGHPRLGLRHHRLHGASALGGDAALARLRERLRKRGLRLMLDFVPNHMGLDHPWVEDHPEYFIPGRSWTWPGRRRTTPGSSARGDRAPGLRARPVLPRLAGHAAAQLRQPGHAGGDDRRAAEDRRAVRRRALRHGHAGPAGRLRATWGIKPQPFWPEATGACASGPGLLLHGRGVLGPGMDAAATGVRLRLRQAALRPPARGPRPSGA